MIKLKAVPIYAESVDILGSYGVGGVEEDIHCSTFKDTEYNKLHCGQLETVV